MNGNRARGAGTLTERHGLPLECPSHGTGLAFVLSVSTVMAGRSFSFACSTCCALIPAYGVLTAQLTKASLRKGAAMVLAEAVRGTGAALHSRAGRLLAPLLDASVLDAPAAADLPKQDGESEH